MSSRDLSRAATIASEWLRPGSALVQWTHFVTSRCNARCRHCFYAINQGQDELTLGEIERVAASLPPIRLLLISGGEPFLRRDLPGIIRTYWDHCRFWSVSVPTNGYAAGKIVPMVREVCDIAPELQLGVAVSLDGFEELHDGIRRIPGLYRNALKTLEELLALSRERPNLTVSVNTVYMEENRGQLARFLEFIHGTYRPTNHALAMIRGTPADPTLKVQTDVDEYLRLSRWLDAHYGPPAGGGAVRRLRTRVRHAVNRSRYEYIARQAAGGAFEGFCLAGEREFVLGETGDVFACELVATKLGNVRDAGYDFERIRTGEAAREFTAWKRSTRCRCTHECNVRTMLLFDRRKAPSLAWSMLRKKARS